MFIQKQRDYQHKLSDWLQVGIAGEEENLV